MATLLTHFNPDGRQRTLQETLEVVTFVCHTIRSVKIALGHRMLSEFYGELE